MKGEGKMKELYRQFFYVPKEGRVREKVMLCRTALTVAIIVLCLIAMSLTAYAYFSSSVSSSFSTIKAANFKSEISVSDSDGNVFSVNEQGIVDLTPGTYTVEIVSADKSSAKTGFCIVTLNGDKYHTQQIEKNGEGVIFTLKISADTRVDFDDHWGTSSYYGYENAEKNPHYITKGKDIDLTV